MTEHNAPESTEADNDDAFTDVVAAVAAVFIPVIVLVYWLSGMTS